jgi:hypothetical protein
VTVAEAYGVWVVDLARYPDETNRRGVVEIHHGTVITRGFADTVFDREYDDDFDAHVADDGSVCISVANIVLAETLYVTFTRDDTGVHVDLLGCDVLPWRIQFPMVRSGDC